MQSMGAATLAVFCSVISVFAQEPASRPVVGNPAPPLGLEKLLQAPEGTSANWKSLEGKIVILEFWAAWCGPCVAAIPHINKLADEFKNKPVAFTSVTSEKEKFGLVLIPAKRPIEMLIVTKTEEEKS